MRFDYEISEVKPYINWTYFFHAWGLNGKPQEVRDALREEADAMLDELGRKYRTHAVFELFEACSDGDDILVNPASLPISPPDLPSLSPLSSGGVGGGSGREVDPAGGGFRLPMLRQQHQRQCACHAHTPHSSLHTSVCLCLSDFVRPTPGRDHIGVFAATVDRAMEHDYEGDDYLRLLVQTLADRLAEATAERLHERVRRELWGYAPTERLSMEELHSERFQGIRPAVGYPSLPDMSLNFLLDKLIDMQQIGIRLTESGMMMPHASVSGLMLAHPQAHYFDVGPVGDDQLQDYARRRGMSVEEMRRFVSG